MNVDWLSHSGNFLGIEWNVWKAVGWLGNLVFFSRFFVQWYASERQQRVVVPAAFWWLSIAGSGLLFLYALFYRRDSVFIFAYAFTWIPYVRNLVLHSRNPGQRPCPGCGEGCGVRARFCSECGLELSPGAR